MKHWHGRELSREDRKEKLDFIKGPLTIDFDLDLVPGEGPVMGGQDLFRALLYHWQRDTSIFADEEQRAQLHLLLLLGASTASRFGELVDNDLPEKRKGEIDEAEWDCTTAWRIRKQDRPKVICWEDIDLKLVRKEDGSQCLGMSMLFSHHKGADNNPRPVLFTFGEEDDPMYDPIAFVIALALRRGVFANEVKSLKHLYAYSSARRS